MRYFFKNYSGVLWLAPLIALQGTPGTGFFRSVFLFIGLIHLFFTIKHHTPTHSLPSKLPEAWLLGMLTLWLLIQSVVFSFSPLNSLNELADHYGKILLLIWIAVAFVLRRDEIEFSWLLYGIFGGFFIHVISTLSFNAWQYYETGNLAIGDSFLGNYGYVSNYVTGSLAFLLTDLVSRDTTSQRLTNTPVWLVVAALILTLVAQGLLAAKASLLMSIVLIAIAGLAFVFRSTHTKARSLFVIACAIVATIFLGNAFSNRWNGTVGYIGSSMQKSDIRSSFSSAPPQGADGSFYLRYTWGKAGLDGITHRPFGYGYGSEGYGKYISDTYNISGVVSSHSGWIDFTLDNGIPGMTLLLALSTMIAYRGWRSFLQGNPIGLALTLFVVNYIGRCAIDGHLVGSRLTGFAFAAAILWALTISTRNANSPN